MSEESGFLTRVDKEFLTGEKEYTGDNAKQQRYERREAIAERTRQAFQDFVLLYETLDEHERNRIFDVGDPFDHDTRSDFQDSLVDTLAFLYLSLEGPLDSDAIHQRSFRIPFELILQEAVKKAEVDRRPRETFGTEVDVAFDVDVKDLPESNIRRAIDKIAEARVHELTDADMRALFIFYDPDLGILGGLEELAEQVRERRDELRADTDPLTEEEKERLAEEYGVETDGTEEE